MFKKLSAPINVQWELTTWCNHNCIYCYNYWRGNTDSSAHLSAEQRKIYTIAAKEFIKNGIFYVTLTGGEPLNVIEQVIDIIYPMKKAGISIGINTNLTLLDQKKADLLKSLGIKGILTSLQSADERINDQLAQQDGAYKRTLMGMNLAIKNGFDVSINMVVTKINLHTIRDTGKLAKSLGAHTFSATKAATPFNCADFSEYELDNEDFSQMLMDLLWINDTLEMKVDTLEHYPSCSFPNDEVRNILGSRTCSAGKTGCTVGFDGQIRPCSHAHVTYGNIMDGLKNAWDKMEQWRDGSLIPSICKDDCKAYPFKCGGGCRIEAFLKKGKLTESDPLCKHIKPLNSQNFKKKNKLPPDVLVTLANDVKFRSEDFGYIAYGNSHHWLPIDNNLYEILQSTILNGSIKAEDIACAYEIDKNDAIEIIQALVSKQIVKII